MTRSQLVARRRRMISSRPAGRSAEHRTVRLRRRYEPLSRLEPIGPSTLVRFAPVGDAQPVRGRTWVALVVTGIVLLSAAVLGLAVMFGIGDGSHRPADLVVSGSPR